MSNNILTFCLTVLMLITCSGSSAAAASLRFRGRITDSGSGSPLKNVTVTLLELNRTTNTDANGAFSFEEVLAGTYHISGDTVDYYPIHLTIQISESAPTEFDLVMRSRSSLMDRTVVTVNGYVEPVKDTARAIGIVDQPEISRSKLVGLDEVLNSVAGVKAENQSGSEQVRVSIRGRDVRNSFGIIGIRLLVDGVPETDASGETPDLTGIDMAAADHIEVVKGPMSARYGSSAAGIVNLISAPGSGTPLVSILNYGGSYGFQRNQVDFSGSAGLFDFSIDASRTVADGYRDHSAFYSYRTSGRIGIRPAKSVSMDLFLKFNHSNDELPGALTRDAFLTNPTQVEPLYGQFGASENIARPQGALAIAKDFGGDKVLSGVVFSRVLDYELPLPFIFLNGHRPESGVSEKYTFVARSSFVTQRISVGSDFERERDQLREFANNSGSASEPLYANQVRTVSNLGFYAFDDLAFGNKLNVTAGVNYSRVNFDFNDLLGTSSGTKRYDHPAFVLGAAYHFLPNVTAYANVSTGMETPTLSELGRSVSGTAGINNTLGAELSRTYELGGLFAFRNRASLTFAVFRAKVNNEIVPTGVGYPQQTYDNAATTLHNGGEASLTVHVRRNIDWNVAYTYSDFYYQQYTNLLGQVANSKQVPALPRNHLYSSMDCRTTRYGLNGGIGYEFVGKMFADDLNTATADKYMTANVHLSYVRPLTSKLSVKFLFAVNNLSDARYVSYVVPNAQFGEYFYPAAGRNYFGSFQFNWLTGAR